jgi:hypothetical protein
MTPEERDLREKACQLRHIDSLEDSGHFKSSDSADAQRVKVLDGDVTGIALDAAPAAHERVCDDATRHREDRGRAVAALVRGGNLRACDPVTLGDARRVARADGMPLPRRLGIPSVQMLKQSETTAGAIPTHITLQHPREHRPRRTRRATRGSPTREPDEPEPAAGGLTPAELDQLLDIRERLVQALDELDADDPGSARWYLAGLLEDLDAVVEGAL